MNRRLLWSLLFALLLPLAQVAAAAHELSHLRPAEAKSAPLAIHCDQCAVAAAISGGAAPSAPPQLALVQMRSAEPVAPAAVPRRIERFFAFSSRAPPSLH